MSKRCGSSRPMPSGCTPAAALGEIEELIDPDRDRRISCPDPGRHSDEPGRDRASRRCRARGRRRSPTHGRPAAKGLVASGNVERRARLVELIRTHHDATVGDCGLDETLGNHPRRDAQVRRQRSHAAGARMASQQQLHPARRHRADVRARRVRPDHLRRNTAGWGSARSRCASSPRSSRAAISASARSARAPRSRPS